MSPGCFELVGLKKNTVHFPISTCDTYALRVNVIISALTLKSIKIRRFHFSLDTQTRVGKTRKLLTLGIGPARLLIPLEYI